VIWEITGIRKIQMVYLQLMYRCNFECLHCFHGERLHRRDAFTPAETINLLRLMREDYAAEAVTFLGGEPFLYGDLPLVVRQAKRQIGLRVEICSNGYRVERRLAEIAPDLDFLRISLDGIGATNDRIRKRGSYDAALAVLRFAREMGIRTGATMTVTSPSIGEVVPLARTLQEIGAQQLKLHCLRSVGNACGHPELLVADPTGYARLREQLRDADLEIEVVVDEDLSAHGSPPVCTQRTGMPEIERIEADPRGALTMSCKAVGKDAHAFWYDKVADRIIHQPSAADELALGVPDVVYGRV
jgi:MoaA/NifB/PqqE/SkfB family radical SAM enzyme